MQESLVPERQKLGRSKASKCVLILLLGIAPLLMGGLCAQTGPSSSPYGVGKSGTSNTQKLNDQAFSQLQMLSPTVGWATTAKAIIKTSDGGKTWTDVTPSDWEPADNQQSGSTQTSPDMNIMNATFLSPQTAWVAASTPISDNDVNTLQTAVPSAISNKDGTVTVDAGKVPAINAKVYVRSTNDGGATWITSNPISVDNLVGISQLNFIDEHEGWLEVMQRTSASDTQTKGDLYHTVDGGITWNLVPSSGLDGVAAGPIYCSSICSTSPLLWDDGSIPSSSITSQDPLTGLTVAPDCIAPGEGVVANGGNLTPCQTYAASSVRGCLATSTANYNGWGTGFEAGASSTFLARRVSESSGWRSIDGLAAPTGVPDKSKNLYVISNPPVVFPDRDGILPIQMQTDPSDPASNGETHLFLHLYRLTLTSSAGSYNLADYSPTTSFAVPMVWQQHALAALDSGRVFTIGQDYNNGTYGDWNLHEFNGQSWTTLNNVADATIPNLQSVLTAGLSNLDFLSDTQGWVTDGPTLYHLTVANNTVTWSQVYPDPGVSTSNSASTDQIQKFTRTPGAVVGAPQNPPACDLNTPPPPPPTNNPGSGKSNAKTHVITFVNHTSQTIWVGEAGNWQRPVTSWDGQLTPGSTNSLTIQTPDAQLSSGRFWGRTGCVNGKCETADCGTAILCGGAGGVPPASLAEFAFNGSGGQVFYDVSLVDGYNLPMLITSSGGPAPDNCGAQPCVDLNQTCPAPLRVTNGSGQVVACNSACNAFHTDQYCCTGAYGPGVCNPATWPPDVDSAKFFKDAYPHAYSFAYNDDTSTYTCNETCDLTVVFGTTT